MSAQRGVGTMALAKTGLTVAALGVTAYSRALGKKISQDTHVPAESGTEPAASTPTEVAEAQRKLKSLQWAVPALTATIIAVGSYANEQYRPEEVSRGIAQRLLGG